MHTPPKCMNPKPGPGGGPPPATHKPPKTIPKPKPNRNPTTGKPGKPDRTRPQKGQPTIPRENPTGPSLRDPKDPPPPDGEQNPSTPPGGVPQDDPPAHKPDPDPTQPAPKPTPTSPAKKPEKPEEPELPGPPTEDPISRTSASPSPTSTSTPTPSGTAWIGSSSESSSSSDDGAMIGAIIGGLFALLIVACFVSKWRKRRRRETGDLESLDYQPRPLLDKSAKDLDGATSAANEVDDDEIMGPSAPAVKTLSGKVHAQALPPPLDSPITPGAQLNYLTLFSPTASKDEVDDEKAGMLPFSASSRL